MRNKASLLMLARGEKRKKKIYIFKCTDDLSRMMAPSSPRTAGVDFNNACDHECRRNCDKPVKRIDFLFPVLKILL